MGQQPCNCGMPNQSTNMIPGATLCPAPVIENVNKITEIIEVDRHVSSRSITQELNSFKPFEQSWIQKEARCLGATPNNTKNMMDRISICKALAKRNEIDSFLKRMVTGDEKWVTYDNIV
ncbi:histone-lysine N-methyltransferase SETMAR [Trichonephila clavipes]|nr:histone-lysine N-methyltransferase SETMAR [Trichonephila clavipes]